MRLAGRPPHPRRFNVDFSWGREFPTLNLGGDRGGGNYFLHGVERRGSWRELRELWSTMTPLREPPCTPALSAAITAITVAITIAITGRK